MEKYANGDKEIVEKVNKDHSEVKKEHDAIRWYYNSIANTDAILVCNFEKNGVEGYIGGAVLMELGFAHVLNKKIFLLNQIPDVKYVDEIKAVSPVVINYDLNKIS